jgi:hypothetical protein
MVSGLEYPLQAEGISNFMSTNEPKEPPKQFRWLSPEEVEALGLPPKTLVIASGFGKPPASEEKNGSGEGDRAVPEICAACGAGDDGVGARLDDDADRAVDGRGSGDGGSGRGDEGGGS